jgi:hypothetical protein
MLLGASASRVRRCHRAIARYKERDSHCDGPLRIACQQYACEHGIDRPDVTGWKWPF